MTHANAARHFAALAGLDFSPERTLRDAVGLRPYRPGGFVVRAEALGAKTVVHDYGHGGCGVTLAWGTAALAAEAAVEAGALGEETPCAVLGGGVVGLTVALLLAQRGCPVTVYAEALPPETTSDVAAALWGPTMLYAPGEEDPGFLDAFRRAARLSFRVFSGLTAEPASGVRWVRKYAFDVATPGMAEIVGADLYPNARAEPELARRVGAETAMSCDALMIDPELYLPKLVGGLVAAGGSIVRRRFASLEEVEALPEPLVINATGLGARALFGDATLTPIRGQVALMPPAPGLDACYAWLKDEELLYLYPRTNALVLGGTMDKGAWSLEPDAGQRAHMLAAHREILAKIAG